MYETPEGPDVSEAMAIEDYTLGRPNRPSEAVSPLLYRQGWDFAAAEQARSMSQREAGR